jgi:hypothetical protein
VAVAVGEEAVAADVLVAVGDGVTVTPAVPVPVEVGAGVSVTGAVGVMLGEGDGEGLGVEVGAESTRAWAGGVGRQPMGGGRTEPSTMAAASTTATRQVRLSREGAISARCAIVVLQ